MFEKASAFNQDISGWTPSAVTKMNHMFKDATAFNNGAVALTWGANTANVNRMDRMFNGATAFNQNIGGWSTGSVTTMANMFNGATAFNQDLQAWTVPAGMTCTDFATGATAWLAAYPPGTGGSIATTPPLSASMLAAGCGP